LNHQGTKTPREKHKGNSWFRKDRMKTRRWEGTTLVFDFVALVTWW